ncbi:MAG: DUF3047 domain-containing protein [Wenzhouxiangellaceae bacterium]|nr:DUF3047 domain-containing protein [Wenzhouxiangellaceae bacterium]
MMIATTSAAERILPAELAAAPAQTFAGDTDYRLASGSDSRAEHPALHGLCTAATASGHLLETRVDLAQTPILRWRWRVDRGPVGVDPRTREGDDHAARIYLVHERWPRWRSRVVSYVCSLTEPAGADWPNPYSAQFAMVAVAGREAALGQWRDEQRDVAADFQRLHGLQIDRIDALAVMTDCDNTDQPAEAWYGPIEWHAAEPD